MKKWVHGKYRLVAVAVLAVVMSSSVGVLAYTNLDFSHKAKDWQSKHCTEKELNSPNASDKSAICYSINGVEKNANEIETVKQSVEENRGNNSVYNLINSDISTGSISIGGNQTETIVPVDSVISNLTLLNKQSPVNLIESGSMNISVLVNGTDVAFGTYLDNEHTRNTASSNDIQVITGDVVSIKVTTSEDFYLTGTTQQTCWTYNGVQRCNPGSTPPLHLNIGLYLKAK